MIKCGPIQEEDKLLIQAIIKMTKPSVVVEFGVQTGESTKAILEVLDGHLYAFDIKKQHNLEHPNLTFIEDKQENYNLDIVIDLVFFDGAHDYNANMIAFNKLKLADDAIIIVHDTGLWKKMWVNNGGVMTSEGYAHQPHERKFVNDLPLNKIHFHTLKEVRHGITILQKNKYLI